jgi:N-acetylglutamate synthase-like GNAT family acetyltransferase
VENLVHEIEVHPEKPGTRRPSTLTPRSCSRSAACSIACGTCASAANAKLSKSSTTRPATGEFIVMALRAGRAIGTCATLNRPYDSYELDKMAVTPAEHGKGIDELLDRGALARARKPGARRVYLESNPRLQRTIHLYRKLGFREFIGGPSPYERCDIQMESWL